MNKKKKLMVVVGAGASIELGMPSVKCIDYLFCDWSKEFFSLANRCDETLYSHIKSQINNYYNQGTIPKRETNFEELLYTILQLEGLLDNSYPAPLSALLDAKILPKIDYLGLGDEITPSERHLNRLVRILLVKLVYEFRERCEEVKTIHAENFKYLSTFINSLVSEFDTAFISLNYDNLITQAYPNLFTGFNEETGEFDPVSVHERANFNFIYHLHGSIHFDYRDDALLTPNQIYWNKKPPLEATRSRTFSTTPNLEGINQPKSTIIAGYGKTNQIQAVPFRTYYSQIDSIAARADAFLFLGYGFNDPHINNSLYSIRNERKKPIVIIDFADDNSCPLLYQAYKKNTWAGRLNNTIHFDKHHMRMEGYENQPPSISILKKSNSFEISTNKNYPLAVWYNGFINACKNYEKVRDKLI